MTSHRRFAIDLIPFIIKDLDFDLTVLNRRIKFELNKRGISTQEGSAPNRFSANVPASPGKLDATSIDIAVKPGIEILFPYTKDFEGITVVNESLLHVRKIKCSTQRPLVQSGRVVTDIRDAMFCVMKLAEAEERVPPELQAAVLDEQTMLAFWRGVKEWRPDDYSTFQFFLNEVGIDVKESIL